MILNDDFLCAHHLYIKTAKQTNQSTLCLLPLSWAARWISGRFYRQHPIFFSVILPRNEDALIPAFFAKGIVQNEMC